MAISISNTTYENLYIGQGYIKDIFINQSKAVLSLVIGETKKDKVYPQISFYEKELIRKIEKMKKGDAVYVEAVIFNYRQDIDRQKPKYITILKGLKLEEADSILMSRLGITGNRIESANQYVISGKIISALSVTDNLLSIIVESYYDNYWRNSINKTYTTVYFFHKNAKKLQESIHPGDFLSGAGYVKTLVKRINDKRKVLTDVTLSEMQLSRRKIQEIKY